MDCSEKERFFLMIHWDIPTIKGKETDIMIWHLRNLTDYAHQLRNFNPDLISQPHTS